MKWRKKYEPKHWNKKVKVYFQSEIVVASLKSLLSFRVLVAEITCKYFRNEIWNTVLARFCQPSSSLKILVHLRRLLIGILQKVYSV